MHRRATTGLILCALLAGCAQPTDRPATAAAGAPGGDAAGPRSPPIIPGGNPAVGGVVMPAERSIVDNIAAAPILATFARLLAAAGETEALKGAGPFTVFAPSDAAFARLQPGTVDALLKPENHTALVKLLDLHRVAGALTDVELMRRVVAGGGRATLTSGAGEPITVTVTGGIVTLTDAGGNRSYVEVADVRQANGMLHVVNGVLVPRLP